MTRPGSPPPRGRHAAPDDDARPDEARPAGRHAAPDPPRQHAAPELNGHPEPAPRRRHAAPDDSPTGVSYHRPRLGNGVSYRRPDPGANGKGPDGPYVHTPPSASGLGYRGGPPGPNGYRTGVDYPDGSATPGANGVGPHRSEPGPDRYRTPPGTGHHRPEPGPDGYRTPPGTDQHWAAEPGPDDYGRGHHRAEPGPNGYRTPGGTDQHRPEPGPNGYRTPPGTDQHWAAEPGPDDHGRGHHRAEPDPNGYRTGHHRAEPGPDRSQQDGGDREAGGSGYRRPEPGAHRRGGAGALPRPWSETNGYHLADPAPPAVNGYRLDEPVAPVTGFPYSAPSTPAAYPVDGHGVDAAERDAASWPVNGNATELDRPLDPRIAVVPLEDEATEFLDRPAPTPTGRQPKQPHPPRAVVRRRRARRKALEWPFLIVFAVVSAFLIRQYVVQTFYIPSASMHETLVEGDRVLVNKVGYHLHDIHRGDVVVFRKPPNLNVNEDDLIKRVVGLPGETVEGRGGKVYVNGAPLSEPYVEPLCHGTGEFPKVTVPAGRLWMMGDNRCNSSDSRVFGPIDEHLVVGRAFLLAWPFDRLAWL